MASKGAIIAGVVGGVALLAIIAAAARGSKPTRSSTSSSPGVKSKPKPAGKEPTVTPGKENPSTALSVNESVSLAEDPNDLLAAWGMVSPHKVYVQAIAQKLAAAGDTRASDVNARLANWSGPMTYAGLISPEADMVANPLDYAFDQIADQGATSDFTAFKMWAAQFLKANKRTEQAQLIFDQLAATPKVA